jgi:phosphoribosylformylglycinamidine synthase
MRKLQSSIESGLVRSCHDLSEGGLAVAATEMAFAGGLGLEIDPDAVPTTGEDVFLAAKLFGESAGRFLIEVEPGKKDAFLKTMGEAASGLLGQVTDTGRVKIGSAIDVNIDEAKQVWQGTFDW